MCPLWSVLCVLCVPRESRSRSPAEPHTQNPLKRHYIPSNQHVGFARQEQAEQANRPSPLPASHPDTYRPAQRHAKTLINPRQRSCREIETGARDRLQARPRALYSYTPLSDTSTPKANLPTASSLVPSPPPAVAGVEKHQCLCHHGETKLPLLLREQRWSRG